MELFGLKLQVEDQIAHLILDYPNEKVNKLSTPMMKSLGEAFDWLAQNASGFRACIISSAKQGSFVVGADIDEIKDVTDPSVGAELASAGQAVFTKITGLPVPVICLIDGTCLGGGLEMALACHYRIATDSPKTKIGLPEVMLGIIPGFGGTQRLPRLIGLQRSLPLILSGKTLDAKRAYRTAIIDQVIPAEFPMTYAKKFAEDMLGKKSAAVLKRRKPKGIVNAILEGIGRGVVFSQARKGVLAQTKGQYPAPLCALKAVREGYSKSIEDGLRIEAQYLGQMIATPISKNLIRIFRQTEDIKKSSGISDTIFKAPAIQYAGVLGAGVMGGGIGYLFSNNGVEVRMKDINHEALGLGLASSRQLYDRARKRRRLTSAEVSRKMSLISTTLDYSGFRRCQVVVEAIVENMDIKKTVLKDLGNHVNDDCIIASNTSSLSITEMGSVCRHPENFVGMHFFNPVHRMPLVEVIRGNQTSDAATAAIFSFAKKLGKTPIVVNDGPGFLVNRLLMPYLNEAGFLLEQGQTIEVVDSVMKKFGMPMGPALLIDEVGIDVAVKVGKIFQNAFGQRVTGSSVLENLYQAKRLGKKGKLGFYKHTNGKPVVDPDVYSLIDVKERVQLTAQEIVERMVYSMINEAALCLADGIVSKVDDVEIGMIFGTGFPPFRGGLLRYADTVGVEKVTAALEEYAAKYGDRFAPCEHLKKMATSNTPFHHN